MQLNLHFRFPASSSFLFKYCAGSPHPDPGQPPPPSCSQAQSIFPPPHQCHLILSPPSLSKWEHFSILLVFFFISITECKSTPPPPSIPLILLRISITEQKNGEKWPTFYIICTMWLEKILAFASIWLKMRWDWVPVTLHSGNKTRERLRRCVFLFWQLLFILGRLSMSHEVTCSGSGMNLLVVIISSSNKIGCSLGGAHHNHTGINSPGITSSTAFQIFTSVLVIFSICFSLILSNV